MTRLDKIGLLGGAIFAGLATLLLYNFNIYFPHTVGLVESAYLGDPLEIRLSPEACTGTLARTVLVCDGPYVGHRYFKSFWEFTGPKRGFDTPQVNGDDHSPDKRGVLSLWGILLQFDDTGRLTVGGKEVGAVKVTRQMR